MQEFINSITALLGPFVLRALYAIVLLIAAWIVSSIVKAIAKRALGALKIDERLATTEDSDAGQAVVSTLSDVVYWIVFLCFIPAILGVLGLDGILAPVQTMMGNILGFLPNVLGAVLIFVIGSLVARILRQIVTSLLVAAGLNKLIEKTGVNVAVKNGVAGIVGTVVYALVLLGVLSAALSVLSIEAISTPINTVVNGITGAIPNVFGAAIVLVVAFMIGRVVSGLIANVLTGIGFNSIPKALGFSSIPTEGDRTASTYVGQLAFLAMMFFAVTSAANILGFTKLTEIFGELTVFGGQLITGVVIFGIGLYLANLAVKLINESGVANASTLATVARAAILIFTGAMALRRMGLADDIVNLAFGLSLGSLAIAAAVAFGVGGIDFAKRILARFNV